MKKGTPPTAITNAIKRTTEINGDIPFFMSISSTRELTPTRINTGVY